METYNMEDSIFITQSITEPKEYLIDQIIDLYVLDGWAKLSKFYDNDSYFIMNDSGEIYLRYIEWYDEHDDYGNSRWFVSFWNSQYDAENNNYDGLDEMIDNSCFLLVTKVAPGTSLHSVEARKLLEEYWYSFEEDINHD